MAADRSNRSSAGRGASLRCLARASRRLSEEPDPACGPWNLVCALREDLSVDRAGVFAYDRAAHRLDRVVGVDPDGQPEYFGESLGMDGAVPSPFVDVARRKLAYYFTDDLRRDYPHLDWSPRVRALAVIPIVAGDEFLGILCADNYLTGNSMLSSGGAMIISEEMNAALNEQVGNEFSASLQYVAIAAYFARESLPELAAHFYLQAEEERAHALRFVRFLVDAGSEVHIPAIPEARGRFRTAEEAVKKALDGEVAVTQQVTALVDRAIKEADHITHNALQWFVTEQLQELSSMETLLRIVQRAGEQGLLHVEEYLARHRSVSAAVEG
jgi:bacterioferritin B